ncbi:MAG TPA: sugar phosphate isomerase/epimerase family protein [Thermomicrobiales bacterium]|nr:sugar phosphate isomerase/epimerase family protein [Thermomicrobiales bacterium]
MNNPIGANTWIWMSPPTDERLAALAPRLRDWGFNLIELPIESPGDWDPARTAALLNNLGLGATICAAMSPERDLTSGDAAVVAATQAYLRHCIDAEAALGGSVVAGPIYAPVGQTGLLEERERAARIDRLARNLAPVAAHAAERGVRLGLEPLNRFETNLINTAAQALEVVERVDSPALGILLDTFHMNVEEKHPAAAIRAVGRHLVHFHACGTDRGTPGSDHTDWTAIAQALADIAYDGPVVIESFTSENQAIATAASIWRPLAASQDEIAVQGLAFLRQLAA